MQYIVIGLLLSLFVLVPLMLATRKHGNMGKPQSPPADLWIRWRLR